MAPAAGQSLANRAMGHVMETILALIVGALVMKVWHLQGEVKALQEWYLEDDEEEVDGPGGGLKTTKPKENTLVVFAEKGQKSA